MVLRFIALLLSLIVIAMLLAWGMLWAIFEEPFPAAGVNSVNVSDAPGEVFWSFFVLFGAGLFLLAIGWSVFSLFDRNPD